MQLLIFQRGVESDIGFEELGYGAAALRIIRGLLEIPLVSPGYLRLQVQMNSGYGEPLVGLFEIYRCCCFDTFGSEIKGGQLKREGHRKTARVGSGDQLFGIGALAIFKACLERVLRIGEDAALGRDRALSAF